MFAKKILSFSLVFIAGMIFGAYMIFDGAYDVGASSVKVAKAIYAEKPTTETINTIVDTVNNLPIVANMIVQLNWGYLQWALLIFFFLAIAFIVWPSKNEEDSKGALTIPGV